MTHLLQKCVTIRYEYIFSLCQIIADRPVEATLSLTYCNMFRLHSSLTVNYPFLLIIASVIVIVTEE